jgi:RimJ/RimL family protein N-acetyltransferase
MITAYSLTVHDTSSFLQIPQLELERSIDCIYRSFKEPPNSLSIAKSDIFIALKKNMTESINPLLFTVTDNKQEVIGLCYGCQRKETLYWLGKLCTRPDHQGKGIANKMLTELINVVSSQNYQYLGLKTKTNNIAGKKLYSKNGFLETGKKVLTIQDEYTADKSIKTCSSIKDVMINPLNTAYHQENYLERLVKIKIKDDFYGLIFDQCSLDWQIIKKEKMQLKAVTQIIKSHAPNSFKLKMDCNQLKEIELSSFIKATLSFLTTHQGYKDSIQVVQDSYLYF